MSGMELVQDELRMRWSWYRIELVQERVGTGLSRYGMAWVEDLWDEVGTRLRE